MENKYAHKIGMHTKEVSRPTGGYHKLTSFAAKKNAKMARPDLHASSLKGIGIVNTHKNHA